MGNVWAEIVKGIMDMDCEVHCENQQLPARSLPCQDVVNLGWATNVWQHQGKGYLSGAGTLGS